MDKTLIRYLKLLYFIDTGKVSPPQHPPALASLITTM
jgi:hypothetical protein